MSVVFAGFQVIFWFERCCVASTKRKKHSAVVGCFFAFCPSILALKLTLSLLFSFCSARAESERRVWNPGSKFKTTRCQVVPIAIGISPVFSISSALEPTGESIENTAVRFLLLRRHCI